MDVGKQIYASVTYNGGVKYEGNIYLNGEKPVNVAQAGGTKVEDLEKEITQDNEFIVRNNIKLQKMIGDKKNKDRINIQKRIIQKKNLELENKKQELLNAKDIAASAAGEELAAQLLPLDSEVREATPTFTMPVNLPTPPPSQIEQVNPSEKQRENSQIINPSLILPTATGSNARRKLFTAAKQVISQNKLINSTQMDKGKIIRDQNLLTVAADPKLDLDTTSGSDTELGEKSNAFLDPASANTDLDSSPIATSIKSAKNITLNATYDGKTYTGTLTHETTLKERASNLTQRANASAKNIYANATGALSSATSSAKGALVNAKDAVVDKTRKLANALKNPIGESIGGKTRNKRRRPRRRVTYKYKPKPK